MTPHQRALSTHAAAALARIARLLAESLDPREVAARIADSVRLLLDPAAAAVYELTVDGDLLAIAIAGDAGSPDDGPLVFPRGTGLGAVAVAERAIVATGDILHDPRVELRAPQRARLERAQYRAAVAAPLLARGRVIGVLGLGLRAGRALDDEGWRIVEAFADQAAIALDNARLHAETRAAQRRLEIEHRQFKALFDSALEAVVIVDDDRRYVDANDAAATLFGVRREALIGRRLDDFVVSSDSGGSSVAWDEFLAAGEQQGEVTLARPDGELRLAEYSARAHFVPGRHLSIMRDVTERRIADRERQAAQNRFAVLAELAHTLSQTLDPDAVGERIADSARALLRARASILYTLTAKGLVIVAAVGGDGPGRRPRSRAGAGHRDGVARRPRAPARGDGRRRRGGLGPRGAARREGHRRRRLRDRGSGGAGLQHG